MSVHTDPYLHALYWSLNDSPTQRKFRALCPLPIGVVYIQHLEHTIEDVRANFRLIRECGFTALKQIILGGEEHIAATEAEQIAIDEGLVPWHYGLAGWREITPEMLDALGIPRDLPAAEIQAHPAMQAYQEAVLRARSEREPQRPKPPSILGGMGEPGRSLCTVPPRLKEAFIAWLERQYGTPEAAMRMYKRFRPFVPRHDAPAGDTTEGWTWEQVVEPFIRETDAPNRPSDTRPPLRGWMDFRRTRDVMRFLADQHHAGILAMANWSKTWDPDEPLRTGCHMVFENQALNGWDFELQASAMRDVGSFYASFHPAHHLTEVNGELERPCYITARYVQDFFKGGWSAMWESVGGPTQYSGTYSFYVDGNTMTKCLLSYLAAGLKGAGLWCWNVRDIGFEMGEYALTDLTGKPSPRAIAAGQVSRACQQHRFELWEAMDEPRVGILFSWENDAAFARMSMGGYELERLKEYPPRPSLARIGAARALINGNVPFEFVTERDLTKGLAGRYRTIYVPHTICLADATVAALRAYAEAGGHVVIDAPTLLVNERGSLYHTEAGSDFERLFGFEVADMQHTQNHATSLHGQPLAGQTFDVNITTASVLATFDGTERPAILQHAIGAGKATALAFEASSLCHTPGNSAMEALIVQSCLDGEESPWSVDAPVIVYRRVAPGADHIFLINDQQEELTVTLTTRDRTYIGGEDCLAGEPVAVQGDTVTLTVPRDGGRWVRLLKG